MKTIPGKGDRLLLGLTVVSSGFSDFSRPEIMEHPRATIALKGQDVRLSCAMSNGSIDSIHIVWRKDLKPIDTSHSEVKEITQVCLREFKFVICDRLYKNTSFHRVTAP